MATTILGVTVPDFPLTEVDEPCHLFCCNFLFHRRYRDLALYCGPSERQSPLEKLVEAIRALRMESLPPGTPVRPGDLIVIYKGARNRKEIRHSMIVFDTDNWYGASNYGFFSHLRKDLPQDVFLPRDCVSMLQFGVDFSNYTFGRYSFDVWRDSEPEKQVVRE